MDNIAEWEMKVNGVGLTFAALAEHQYLLAERKHICHRKYVNIFKIIRAYSKTI